jgi:hypothetical protein
MERQKKFEKMMKPFRLKMPFKNQKVKKRGRECWSNCRICPFHRPRRKGRLCVFRECPFVPEMSTATYFTKMKNRNRDYRWCVA